MPLLRYLSAHMPETKYLHYIQILREDVNTIRKPFSDSLSKISASSIGCSLPYLCYRHRQMFFTKTIFKKQKFFIQIWENIPENHVPPLTKQKHAEMESLLISESTEKSSVFQQYQLVHEEVCVQFQTCALNFSSFLGQSILLPMLYFQLQNWR